MVDRTQEVPLSEVWTSKDFSDEDRREVERWLQSGAAVRIWRIMKEATPTPTPTTREGELCWVTISAQILPGGGRHYARARLLKWAQDFTEFESGPGSYPVAVIELIDTGEVSKVDVQAISFAADCPGVLFNMKKGV